MTNYEKIKSMPIDELVNHLSQYYNYESSPWCKWFDKNYCAKCKPIVSKYEDSDREVEFAPCELRDLETGEYKNPCGFAHCEIFKVIKAWLMSEAEDD